HKAMDDELRVPREAPQVRLFVRIECGELRPGSAIAEPMDPAGERALADYERSLPRPQKPLMDALATPVANKGEAHELKELQRLQRRLAKADTALRKATDEQVRLRDAVNRAESAGVQARRELGERFDEIAALTGTLLDRDAQVARLDTECRALSHERDVALADAKNAATHIR